MIEDWTKIDEELGCQDVYLVARATQGLVDPGAGSDLVGLAALNRESHALAEVGLRFEVTPKERQRPRAAHGVGGPANVVPSVLFPLMPRP
eukprot:1190899-Pyramimonas_sp.AAC.1